MAKMVVQGDKSHAYMFTGRAVKPQVNSSGQLVVTAKNMVYPYGKGTQILIGGVDITHWVRGLDYEVSHNEPSRLTIELFNVEVVTHATPT